MSACDEPTQETQPASGEPVTIPVPTKRDVFDAFRKVAKVSQRSEDAEDSGAGE